MNLSGEGPLPGPSCVAAGEKTHEDVMKLFEAMERITTELHLVSETGRTIMTYALRFDLGDPQRVTGQVKPFFLSDRVKMLCSSTSFGKRPRAFQVETAEGFLPVKAATAEVPPSALITASGV